MADEEELVTHSFPRATFRLAARFRPEKVIGAGAYGTVCQAKDAYSNKVVAIKKIPDAFMALQIARRTLREIKLLKHFQGHKNISAVLMIQRPPPLAEFNDLYVVLEWMESDLHRIIHSPQPLTEEHSRYFLYQLLNGLSYIHSANVIHRDIKPSNLLINSNCLLKICDFGMARPLASTPQEHANFLTAYVATRWYRAPEVMLSFHKYTQAIDVWSVGCILAEMLGRRFLFPGQNYLNQIDLILQLLGSPSEDVLQRVGGEHAGRYLRSLPPRPAQPLSSRLPDASAEALDLLSKLLRFDPEERCSIEEAMHHPFLKQYAPAQPSRPCKAFSFGFEEETLTLEQIKSMVHGEAMEFHTPGTEAYQYAQIALPKIVRTVVNVSRTPSVITGTEKSPAEAPPPHGGAPKAAEQAPVQPAPAPGAADADASMPKARGLTAAAASVAGHETGAAAADGDQHEDEAGASPARRTRSSGKAAQAPQAEQDSDKKITTTTAKRRTNAGKAKNTEAGATKPKIRRLNKKDLHPDMPEESKARIAALREAQRLSRINAAVAAANTAAGPLYDGMGDTSSVAGAQAAMAMGGVPAAATAATSTAAISAAPQFWSTIQDEVSLNSSDLGMLAGSSRQDLQELLRAAAQQAPEAPLPYPDADGLAASGLGLVPPTPQLLASLEQDSAGARLPPMSTADLRMVSESSDFMAQLERELAGNNGEF